MWTVSSATMIRTAMRMESGRPRKTRYMTPPTTPARIVASVQGTTVNPP